MKTNSYDIFSNSEFIGFAFVTNNGHYVHGYLTLYEAVQINGILHLAPNITKQSTYPLTIVDIDVIRDLMLKAIPTLRTNGLAYSAIDINGISTTI
jgi:hypothetical protein